MINSRELQCWIDFLAGQIVVLEGLYSAESEALSLSSPELVAFLQTNDALLGTTVEQAVAGFAEWNAWPCWLKPDHIVNLLHRATMAHGLLTMIQNGQLLHAHKLETPKSTDRPRVLAWLFIDLWSYGGANYLEGLTNSYFADPPKLK